VVELSALWRGALRGGRGNPAFTLAAPATSRATMRHSCIPARVILRYGFRTRRDDARPHSQNSVSMHRFGRYSCADLHVEIMRGYPFGHCRLPLSHDNRLTSHSTTLQSP
jgi:hypothetical protein